MTLKGELRQKKRNTKIQKEVSIKMRLPIQIEIYHKDTCIDSILIDTINLIKPHYFDIPINISENKHMLGIKMINGKICAIYADSKERVHIEEINYYFSK